MKTQEQRQAEAFTRVKSKHVITYAHLAMRDLETTAYASKCGKPFEGRRVFVVGAGPSLQKNIGELRGLGGAIFAVNASAKPLAEAGIVPDVLVARESLDLSDQIQACPAPIVALDISSHPATWKAAGDRRVAFIPGYPRHMPLCQMLGERPVFGGTAAATSAVALALMWGAHSVVLLGFDLSIPPDGQVYHPSAPRGDLKASVGKQAIEFEGNVEDDARCERSGQAPPPKRIGYTKCQALDFSQELYSQPTWDEQREWLETTARRYGSDVELLNATHFGAGIRGWRNARLSELTGVAEPFEQGGFRFRPKGIDPERAAQVRSVLSQQAAVLETAAREMLASGGPSFKTLAAIPNLYLGAPFTAPLAAHRIIDAPQGPPLVRNRAIYESFRDVAASAQELLDLSA